MKTVVFLLFLFMSCHSLLSSQNLSDVNEDQLRKRQVENYYLEKYKDVDTYMLIKKEFSSSFFRSDTLVIVNYLDREGTYLFNLWGTKLDSVLNVYIENETHTKRKQHVLENYIIHEIIQGRLTDILEKGKCDSIKSTNPVFLRILIASKKRNEYYKIESYTIHSFFPPSS